MDRTQLECVHDVGVPWDGFYRVLGWSTGEQERRTVQIRRYIIYPIIKRLRLDIYKDHLCTIVYCSLFISFYLILILYQDLVTFLFVTKP